MESDSQKYLLPVLTSYIKQGMVDAALKRVQILAGNFPISFLKLLLLVWINIVVLLMISSLIVEESLKDQALKYMAVLVDGDQLYKEALATYDLQLTLMVAHRSQKVISTHF
jgi:elongator complex protein 1